MVAGGVGRLLCSRLEPVCVRSRACSACVCVRVCVSLSLLFALPGLGPGRHFLSDFLRKYTHLGSQGHPGSRIAHIQALKTVQAREIRAFRPRRPKEILPFRPARPSGLEKCALSGLEGPPDQRHMHTQRQKALTKLTAAALRSAHLDSARY